jgi:cytosine/adenosine deaminase-related metal-dependent hydrolase
VANGGTVAVGLDSFGGDGTFSEIREMNNAGVITSASTVTGTYGVDPDGVGRGSIGVPGSSLRAFYLAGPGKAFVISLGSYEAGSFEPQTGGPFSNASLSGNYVVGTLPWTSTGSSIQPLAS